MHCSDTLKVYWYTPKRTGTRSSVELMKSLNFKNNEHRFHFEKDKKDYYFVSNIRNPYSRIVSIFYLNSFHKKNFDRDFKIWIFETLKNKQFIDEYQLYYHLYFEDLGRDFDKFIRLENFKEDVLTLPFMDLNVPSLKKAYDEHIIHNGYKKEFESSLNNEKQPWKSMYDEETADYFYSLLKEQFDFFGYNKNSWKDGTP